MIIEGGIEKATQLLIRQLYYLTSLNLSEEAIGDKLKPYIGKALERTEKCLFRSRFRHNTRNGQTYYNPLHQGQNALFLYYLGNTIYKADRDCPLPQMLSSLNKMLNGIDLHLDWICRIAFLRSILWAQ